jgi:hypothetical protein
MPEPQAKTLSVLKSILLSQGQFIYHNNALYISNYYFYFIEGNKTFKIILLIHWFVLFLVIFVCTRFIFNTPKYPLFTYTVSAEFRERSCSAMFFFQSKNSVSKFYGNKLTWTKQKLINFILQSSIRHFCTSCRKKKLSDFCFAWKHSSGWKGL